MKDGIGNLDEVAVIAHALPLGEGLVASGGVFAREHLMGNFPSEVIFPFEMCL